MNYIGRPIKRRVSECACIGLWHAPQRRQPANERRRCIERTAGPRAHDGRSLWRLRHLSSELASYQSHPLTRDSNIAGLERDRERQRQWPCTQYGQFKRGLKWRGEPRYSVRPLQYGAADQSQPRIHHSIQGSCAHFTTKRAARWVNFFCHIWNPLRCSHDCRFWLRYYSGLQSHFRHRVCAMRHRGPWMTSRSCD